MMTLILQRLSCASILLFGVFMALPAHADEQPLSAEVLEFLQQQQQPLPFTVSFEQQRSITGLPRPLLSSGKLTIATDEVVWHTQKPFEQQLIITADGIQSDDQTKLRGSEVVGQLLLAVLQGDAQAIAANFAVQLKDSCLVLTPKLAQLQQFVESIKSCGGEQIERIRLVEQQGNESNITFQPEASESVATH